MKAEWQHARGTWGGWVSTHQLILGLIRPDPIILIIGIAAALAGIGYYGSSRGSLDQITGKIREHEARRAEIIDGMDLQPVQDR